MLFNEDDNMSINSQKNDNQFLTIESFKSIFGITDDQDNDVILEIVNDSNGEIRSIMKAVVDNTDDIENSLFFPRAHAAALKFAEAEKLRRINQMYDEAKETMTAYTNTKLNLINDILGDAPERASRALVSREIPEEDIYFATRRWP